MDSADCRFGHSSRARSSCIYRLGSAAALFVLLLSVSNSVGMLLVEGAANAQAGISRYDICVVGGGVGGLVCAGLLQKSGQSVFLVDKSSRVGGRMGSFHLSVPPEPGPSEPTELSELSGLLAPSIAQEISTGRSLGNPTEELATATGGNRCFRFDTGPSLLLMPDVYRETFSLLGEKLEGKPTNKMTESFSRDTVTNADIAFYRVLITHLAVVLRRSRRDTLCIADVPLLLRGRPNTRRYHC